MLNSVAFVAVVEALANRYLPSWLRDVLRYTIIFFLILGFIALGKATHWLYFDIIVEVIVKVAYIIWIVLTGLIIYVFGLG